jgi:Flp pilus assembly protein TadD
VGVELAKQGRAADALANFQLASAEYPKADFALGLTFASLNRHDEALRALDAFLVRVPDDVDVPAAYAAIGRSAAALDQRQVAEGAYRTALRLVPSTDAARIGLADLLRRASRDDEAIVEYRAYLARVPGDANAHSNLGIALIAKGDGAAAVEAFTAAVRLAPGDAEKHENLGHALASSGRMAEAVASYQTAVALAPNRPEFRSALGSALVVQGNVEEGLTEIRRALAADPGNPAVRSDAQLAADWVQSHRANR